MIQKEKNITLGIYRREKVCPLERRDPDTSEKRPADRIERALPLTTTKEIRWKNHSFMPLKGSLLTYLFQKLQRHWS